MFVRVCFSFQILNHFNSTVAHKIKSYWGERKSSRIVNISAPFLRTLDKLTTVFQTTFLKFYYKYRRHKTPKVLNRLQFY